MIIPVGYAQVNLQFTGSGVPNGAEATLGLDIGGATSPAIVAGDVSTAWGTGAFKDRMSSDVSLTGILVKFGPNSTGPSAQITVAHPGGQAATCAPPNVSLLLHKNTAAGGHAGRGRFYIPGPPANAIDDAGNLGGAFVAAGDNEIGDFLIALSAAGLDPVLLHAAGSPLSTPTPITSMTLDAKVATQRRRLRR